MNETAESYLGTTITNAVVTVLAYFNDTVCGDKVEGW
jgi:molecular chaperone DnaK (HSP70)